MNALLHIGLSNAAVCGIMTVLLLPLARWLRKPALTHALCVLILLKLLTPPIFNVPVMRHSTGVRPALQQSAADATRSNRPFVPMALPADATEPYAPTPAEEPAFESVPRMTFDPHIAPPKEAPQALRGLLTRIWMNAAEHWRSWLLAAWIASAVMLGLLMLRRIIRLGKAVRRATVLGPDLTQEIELLSQRLGIRRAPRVRFIVGSAPPMLLGLFCRPELILPIGLWKRLDDRQRQTLLLHELAHLRRGDHWVRYLELLATCVYWWHLATWLARWALHEAEEHCCDAWVVWAMPDASRTYMTTLLDAIDFLSQPIAPRLAAAPALASGMGQFHNLQRRLTMVREQTVQRRLGARGLAAVALLSAIALPLGAKVAGGDDQAPAQPAATPAPRTAASATASDRTTSSFPRYGTSASSSASSSQLASADYQGSASSAAAQPQDEVAQLEQEVARFEAELAAARDNLQRVRRQLDQARTKSAGGLRRDLDLAKTNSKWQVGHQPQARLGHILFTYQSTGADGILLAFDGPTKKLLWSLKMPLNADSVVQCYDNETLLIKSADGYTRLVTAEDGQVIRAWAPGVQAPASSPHGGVNPFGTSGTPQNHIPATSLDVPNTSSRIGQDQEKRLERMEESIRMLTETVNRLAGEKDQGNSTGQRK